MALKHWYVNPDSTGGAQDGTSDADAYLTLNACDLAKQEDLTTNGNSVIIHCNSSGSADGTAVDIDLSTAGWNPGASNTLIVRVDEGNRWKGAYDSTAYRLISGGASVLQISGVGGYLTIDGLQLINSGTGYNAHGIRQAAIQNDILVKNVFAKYTGSGSTEMIGLNFQYDNDNIVLENCVLVDWKQACYMWSATLANILVYSCIAYNSSGVAFDTGYLDTTFVNCIAIGQPSTGFGSVKSGSGYNCSDTETPSDTGSIITTQTDAQLFVDAASDDFQPVSGADTIGAGIGTTDSSVPAYDEKEIARASDICTIGAFEFVAADGGIEIFRRRIEGY